MALIIESSRAYGRGLLLGVARYARAHGPWVLNVEERTIGDAAPRWLNRWRGDGIIARVENAGIEAALYETGVPVIDVRGTRSVSMPVIDTDDRAVAWLAAEHLYERGFRQFAFCGYGGLNYSELRLESFRVCAERLGVPLSTFESRASRGAALIDIERQGAYFDEELAQWVLDLRKPVGLMACNDVRGQQVINTCRQLGVPIPEEVAVVGVDDDEVLCELSDPTMSSVIPDTARIGHEAGALLDRMMSEGYRSTERILVPPTGIVARQSTASLAVADRVVAKAVHIIRQNATSEVSVDDIATKLAVTRRTLERRFRRVLGRSPKEEFIRCRIERIKELLRTTDWNLCRIAERCGFQHAEYMSVLFKRKTGQTPGEYRAESVP